MGRKYKQRSLSITLKKSAAKKTPLGKETYPNDVIGPHGTSEFCDRVLDGGLGEADKESDNYVEAYELV